MKKLILSFFSLVFCFNVFSQKITVKVIRNSHLLKTDWSVLSSTFDEVFAGSRYFKGDTVVFSLEANKNYIFSFSLNKKSDSSFVIYTLVTDGEPILAVKSDVGPGDHLLPFYASMMQRVTKIVGGTDASIADFPWQVFFRSDVYLCGGIMISDHWVLTAAHCTQDANNIPIPASKMSIKVGADDPFNASEGRTFQVAQVIPHENFNPQTLENDLALLRFSSSITGPNASPINLVTIQDAAGGATNPGVMAWVTGWGLIKVTPNTFPTALQKLNLPIISNAQASTVWDGQIASTDLMAGYLNGNRDACNGDSGGPLVVPVLTEFRVAGIVSWGSSQCNTYGAYTRVSIFEDWIREKTGIPKAYVPPTPSGDTVICQGVSSSTYSVGSISGASAYEWQVLPAAAASVSGTTSANVSWNTSFTGTAVVIFRATVNGSLSDWSRLNVKIVKNTAVLSQSRDTNLCTGKPITLQVNTQGYNLNYKWFRNGTQIQSGTSPLYTLTSAATSNSGTYQVQVSGACGTVFSQPMNLTVYPLTSITNFSKDMQIQFGNNATLTVNAGGHDLTYQWQKDSVNITGANASSLILDNVNANTIGNYRVIVAGTCGTLTSDKAYVFVNSQNYTGGPEVFLWPSVTNTEFNIAINNNNAYNINIVNEMGQVVRSINNLHYQNAISVYGLAKGTYVVIAYNPTFRKSVRLIIN